MTNLNKPVNFAVTNNELRKRVFTEHFRFYLSFCHPSLHQNYRVLLPHCPQLILYTESKEIAVMRGKSELVNWNPKFTKVANHF